jgi:hypothetical protein
MPSQLDQHHIFAFGLLGNSSLRAGDEALLVRSAVGMLAALGSCHVI